MNGIIGAVSAYAGVLVAAITTAALAAITICMAEKRRSK